MNQHVTNDAADLMLLALQQKRRGLASAMQQRKYSRRGL
jgi:hypothetical protein